MIAADRRWPNAEGRSPFDWREQERKTDYGIRPSAHGHLPDE
jgi:hypothetical protein